MNNKTYTIAVIPGDGTGPEVVAEGLKVLRAIGEKDSISFHFIPYDLGGDRYLKTGEILPDSILRELRQADAIYLGAIGHPEVKPGILEQGLLLKLRFELDQYINLRPVILYPRGGDAAEKQGTGGYRFRGYPGEYGRALCRNGWFFA